MDRKCKCCNTPINHLHGNRKYCYKCSSERKYARSQISVRNRISMTIPVFNELEKNANLGKLFDTVTHEDKQFLLRLIERMATSVN